MSRFRVQTNAGHRLDEIYVVTRHTWGEVQAERYIRGPFGRFAEIAERRFPWRQVPAEFGVEGYFFRYEKHFIYWKQLGYGSIGIVAILHERMYQLDRFREDFPS